jgi:tripartite-type tricarboxylate transporter receptor subunit TctC
MRRRDVLAFGMASLSSGALRSLPALAQGTYPEHPIRLVVPRSAGGVVDVVGRL